ncbi:type II toxin-antitoxin system VapC family toxin [Roseomonas sp. NAR14]|uniref:Type II toxin-antitoxin system VapC family toxin n=1 Tax=Roseomonas acroporae TaxID=2937791 RepID=A0A9X1YL55_9PROT|nr:type II toxin-antitoxin system VapC family toxin [Roseomonas acroporae]MCK8787996.1 type II toxin-antitoxin system VapC family toxin [Roseomonas acroporae]
MTKERSRVYWDSDCFLAWLQEEAGKVDGCRAVLDEADAGRTLIVTSALTIAEVLSMRHRQAISASQRSKVQAFFRRDYIAVVNVTRRLAEAARDVVWDHGVMPKDALHVVTAIDAKVSALHTFDERLLKKSGKLGAPAIEICHPFVSQASLDFGKKN